MKLALIISGLCFLTQIGLAQEKDSVRVIDLASITVNALVIPSTKFELPVAVGSISSPLLRVTDQSIITTELNKIPGVYMHNGSLNTNRITIRGIGSRSPFSTNKVRAFYGNIPLTDGGGDTSIEDIDMSFIESIEIQKGPNASLYGAGLGGLILLKPLEIEGNQAWVNSTLGSFGLSRVGAGLTINSDNHELKMSVVNQHSDGYRENNTLDRSSFFLDWKKKGAKSDIGFLVLHTDQKAFIPSSIGISDFKNEPEKAAFIWGSSRGFEDYERTLVGISGETRYNAQSSISYSVYATGRDNYEPRPFNILSEQMLGAAARIKGITEKNAWQWSWTVEGYSDRLSYKTFENLYLMNPNTGSIRGDQLTSNEASRSFFNYGISVKNQLGEKTRLEGALNLNHTFYRFNTKTKKNFGIVYSPRISIVHSLNSELNMYGTLSHGLSSLSVDETLNEDQTFNTSIKPETGWNREVGIKGNHRWLGYSVSFFLMNIKKLLVIRRTAEDVTFGLNAGKTKHEGMEMEMEMLIFSIEKNQLTAQGSYALANYWFEEFTDQNGDYSGNELTGVPLSQAVAGIRFKSGNFSIGTEYSFVDEMPITDDNSVYSESYALWNGFISFSFPVQKWNFDLTGRLNNILDEQYASMLGVNAQAFGASEPRYYYPGLPRNGQISLRVAYKM